MMYMLKVIDLLMCHGAWVAGSWMMDGAGDKYAGLFKITLMPFGGGQANKCCCRQNKKPHDRYFYKPSRNSHPQQNKPCGEDGLLIMTTAGSSSAPAPSPSPLPSMSKTANVFASAPMMDATKKMNECPSTPPHEFREHTTIRTRS